MRAMTSADWNSRYAATDFVWSTTPNQFLVEEVADLTPGRALELAAGEVDAIDTLVRARRS